MKKLVLIWLLFFAASAFAQQTDASRGRGFGEFRTLDEIAKPAIIVDKKIYKGAISNIKPDNIYSLNVLKDPYGAVLFGIDAAFVIETRSGITYEKKETKYNQLLAKNPLFVVDGVIYKNPISSLKPSQISSINLLPNEVALKTYGKVYEHSVILIKTKNSLKEVITLANKPKAIVLDGKLISGTLQNIDANDIFKIDVLISPQEVGSNQIDTTLLVATKSFAIKKYQQKFSLFSPKYRGYLEQHKFNDAHLLYVIDGIPKAAVQMMDEFYSFSLENISKATFEASSKSWDHDGGSEGILYITTKK